jgi:hypothetical protein
MEKFDNFELYDRRKAKPIVRQPIVTLQKRGNFGLNKAAYEALGRPRAILLSHATKDGQHIVGFRSTNMNSPRAYPVRAQTQGGSYQVAGKAFCDHFGVPYDESRRFSGQMIEDDLVVHLVQTD